MLSVAQGFGMVTLALGAALWSRDPAAKSQGISGSCCWCGLQPAHGEGSKGNAPHPCAALGVMPVILGVGLELFGLLGAEGWLLKCLGMPWDRLWSWRGELGCPEHNPLQPSLDVVLIPKAQAKFPGRKSDGGGWFWSRGGKRKSRHCPCPPWSPCQEKSISVSIPGRGRDALFIL